MPLHPLAVAALSVATRGVVVIVTVEAALTAALHIKQTGSQLKQGWREARRQRALLKLPRLTHNKEFDNVSLD